MRPVGSWLFGRIADKRGRRMSMMIAVGMMCFGSLLVAVLPTYASWGIAAPASLLFARLLQGLSVGGEYGTCATSMSEVPLHRHRGFFASFQYVTLIGGQLLAVLVLVILQQFLSNAELKAWGWRIPFALGAVAALVAFFLRRSLAETTSSEVRGQKEAGTIRGVFCYRRSFFYRARVHGRRFARVLHVHDLHAEVSGEHVRHERPHSQHGHDGRAVLLHVAATRLRSDFGLDRSPQLDDLLWRVLGCYHGAGAQCARARHRPARSLRSGAARARRCELLHLHQRPGVKAELFPMHVRALGVGLPCAIANAAFGGTAEYVALWFKSIGFESTFFWYVTAPERSHGNATC
jgi:uncharacterized integral membrane protein